jgi:tetratricopeptide (TPR) repeat protein
MGNLDKATELYKRTLDIRPDIGAEARIAYIAGLQEDYDGAIEWCDRFIDAAPSRGLKGSGRFVQSFYYMMAFKHNEALAPLEEARAVMERVGHTFALGGSWWIESYVRYERREYESARECLGKSMSVLKPKNMWGPWLQAECAFVLGLIDLQEGRVDRAKERLEEMHARGPEVAESDPTRSPLLLDHSLLLEGEILLAEERVDDAITVCKKRPDVGIPAITSADMFYYNMPLQRDVLARAYVAKGALDEAIAEYERITTFDPKSRNRRLIYPLFHYRLARLYEEQGRAPEAVREYDKFLEICKGADEGMSEIADARNRLERLLAIRTQ